MDSGVSTGTKCGRWSPTTEQVKVLSDLFKSGLRTPSTDQIQKISSQLSFYGKIESKNVFYWFQNHKARERQKRRRVVIDTDENDVIHKAPVKSFVDVNKVLEPGRIIETLQLFPLNALVESKSDKMGLMENECKDTTTTRFSYLFETGVNYPPLDLRLSFM